MSSIPGYSLEDFLLWNYDITAAEEDDANFSLGLAEALGNISPRPQLTQSQFKGLVAIFEELREKIENTLDWFPGDDQASWRDYAGSSFEYIPKDLYRAGEKYIKEIT